jgi:SHS2 domain-containing protein
MSPFEWFDHTADLGLRVTAPDLDRLFADAASGLYAMIVDVVPPASAAERIELCVPGTRPDWLLFDWLNELLYRFECERVILGDFRVEVGEEGLRATATRHVFDPARQRTLHEVKAITYHGLRVERAAAGGWIAEVVVDI